jgi:hypothetical protein
VLEIANHNKLKYAYGGKDKETQGYQKSLLET